MNMCIYIYTLCICNIYIYVQTGSCSLFFRIPLSWDIRVLLSRQNVSCKHDRLHVTGIPPTFKMVKNPSMRRGLNTSWKISNSEGLVTRDSEFVDYDHPQDVSTNPCSDTLRSICMDHYGSMELSENQGTPQASCQSPSKFSIWFTLW